MLRLAQLSPERTVAMETPFLGDADPDVRALAVWAIGDAGTPEVSEVLAPLVSDSDAVVRLAVVRALCAAGGDTGGAALLILAADPDAATRRAALGCISAPGGEASYSADIVGMLARALADSDAGTRHVALEALTRHPDASATPALVAIFERGGPEDQLLAIAALRASRDPAALPALEAAAASRLAPALRDAVEGAIRELREEKKSVPAEGDPPPAAIRGGTGYNLDSRSPR